MSGYSTRTRATNRLIALVMTIAFSGLLLFTTSCQDLTPDAGESTSSTVDATTTTAVVTEPTSPGTEGSGGGGGGGEPFAPGSEATEPPDPSADSPFTPMSLVDHITWTFDEDHNGQDRRVRVGDTVVIELEINPLNNVVRTSYAWSNAGILRCMELLENPLPGAEVCTSARGVFELIAPGSTELRVYAWTDLETGTGYRAFGINLEVSE